VPRTLSPHATCTYSWRRPPSRSRRSTRMAALGRRARRRAGGDRAPARQRRLRRRSYHRRLRQRLRRRRGDPRPARGLPRGDRPARLDRQLRDGVDHVRVFYAHGKNLDGSPLGPGLGADRAAGADQGGQHGPADPLDAQPLAARRQRLGSGQGRCLRGFSFSGRPVRSSPDRVPRTRPGAALPMVRRLQVSLTEYGPCVNPAYKTAGVIDLAAAVP